MGDPLPRAGDRRLTDTTNAPPDSHEDDGGALCCGGNREQGTQYVSSTTTGYHGEQGDAVWTCERPARAPWSKGSGGAVVLVQFSQ